LWGDFKDTVCPRKPRTLQDLRHKIEIIPVATPPETLQKLYHSIARCYQQSTGAVGGHFEHL
jgi:hypothetical protein